MKKIILFSCLFLAGMFTACNDDDLNVTDDVNVSGTLPEQSDDAIEDFDLVGTVSITYANATVSIDNSVSGVSVVTDGAVVTVTSTVKGVKYLVSGSTSVGSLKIYSDYKFILELSGASIVSTSGPAINIQSGKCGYIVLSGSNKLGDSSNYPESSTEDAKATLFSEGQMLFSGTGSLSVSSAAHHAICSDDYIVVNAGTITVTSAAKDGFHANDYVQINAGTVTINSSSDGIESGSQFFEMKGGDVTITCPASSGCQGIKSDSAVVINGGNLTVTQSYEAIEAIYIVMNSGYVSLTAYDDAINATKGTVSGGTEQNDGSLFCITGGILVASSSNGDAIDSNGNFSMTGGVLIANGSQQSGVEEAVDVNGTQSYIGGTYLLSENGSGGGGGTNPGGGGRHVQAGSTVTGSLYVLNISASISSGSILYIEIDGSEKMVYKPTTSYSSFVFGSDALASGTTYSIYTGGTYSGGSNVDCYYYNGTYSGGTLKKSGTVSQQQTTISF